MSVYDLIVARRSIRQFGPKPVGRDILVKIVNAGRLAPSAANLQPLEFVLIDEEVRKKEIFACLKWASAIAPRGNPRPGHEPQAYVAVLVNSRIRGEMYEYDVGAAIENMSLAALGEGIAGCWLISIDKAKVGELLSIPDSHKLDSILALGYPAQVSKAEDFVDSTKYWQDEDFTFHVPKRTLESVLHLNQF
ncbi:MAG: nitroreductase family protein [Candidatus Aminicenantes bacterium]|nr:nitroreductase family protein [Candidatus Aminicenantes bacterium]